MSRARAPSDTLHIRYLIDMANGAVTRGDRCGGPRGTHADTRTAFRQPAAFTRECRD